MTRPLWFKARPYGWGWYPCSWQGWTVLAIWLAVVALFMSFATVWPIGTLIGVFISVGVLFVVCWRTGERPSWQWAGKPISASRGLSYTVLITFGAIAIAMLGALITTRMQ